MLLNPQPFRESLEYIKLKGTDPRSSKRWRFLLLQDVRIEIPYLDSHPHRVSFRDVNRREWCRIEKNALIIRKGYAWNGATPCWWVPLIGWVGTPTPSPVVLPTLVHDVCFQFLLCYGWPLPVDVCNDIFLALMRLNGFRFSNSYHGAVKDFGSRFIGKYPSQGEHSHTLRDDE